VVTWLFIPFVKYYYDFTVKGVDVGWSCSTPGKYKSTHKVLITKYKRYFLNDVGQNWRIILKWFLNKKFLKRKRHFLNDVEENWRIILNWLLKKKCLKRKRHFLNDVGQNWRIILKWFLKKKMFKT
jgi:hypothetical protein